MKRILTRTFLVAFVVGLLALLPTSQSNKLKAIAQVQAQQEGNNPFARTGTRPCTLGTLKGAYGVMINGTNVASRVIPPGPFIGLKIFAQYLSREK